MCRKLVFLTSVVLAVTLVGRAEEPVYPGPYMELMVDFGLADDADTRKPGWIPWASWTDSDRHDENKMLNVGGSGIDAYISVGHEGDLSLGQPLGQDLIDVADEPLLNSFLHYYRTPDYYYPGGKSEGHPLGDVLMVLTGGDRGLRPGEYWLYSYHRHPADMNDMPKIEVTCNTEDRKDWGGDPNCGLADPCGVTQIHDGDTNDINVPIRNKLEVATDDELLLVWSLVKFWVDEANDVVVRYWAPEEECGVLNAFRLLAPKPLIAWGPDPGNEAEDVCPDVELSWGEGAFAAHHDVYFGTDPNDVNNATSDDPLDVYKDRQPVEDVNYDPPGLLDFDTTYYWRIDVVNDACSPFLWKGLVWSFTTEDGKAHDPIPGDGAWSVAIDELLAWSPSCLAVHHDVYFGTSFDDVNDATDPNALPGQGRQPGDSFDPGPLDAFSRYYWRVDQVGDSTFVKGDVWTFMTIGGTLIHYIFDGVTDANIHDPCDENVITDSTGNVTFERLDRGGTLTYDEANPLYNPLGTSARFNQWDDDSNEIGLMREAVGADILDLAGSAYTIEMWLKVDTFYDDPMALFRKTDLSYNLSITDEGVSQFSHRGGNTVSDPNGRKIQQGIWVHIAAVFDSTDPCESQKLYLDGELVADGNTTALNPLDDDDATTIGVYKQAWRHGPRQESDYFDGWIDELRVSDIALEPSDFLIRYDPGTAWSPKPRHGEQDVPPDVTFIWKPGDYVGSQGSHDVYLGTSWDDVNDADTTSAPIYRGRQDPNEYDPQGLALETTHYWRVDEVDPNGFQRKGLIWEFTTANYIIIDDFEAYNDVDNKIYDTWEDSYWNYTGSYIELAAEPFSPTHGGHQSMYYEYDNTINWGCGYYYSEVSLPFVPPMDFTDGGVEALTLYFYGYPNNDINDTEQMYVGLTGSLAEVWYTDDAGRDMNDLRLEEWTEWNIEIKDFNYPDNVVKTAVSSLVIGFGDRDNTDTPGGGGKDPITLLPRGLVYFDDIRLYIPRCVPAVGPELDLSGNCIVDWADVAIIGEEWLKTDLDFRPPQPPDDANHLVGHWALDGDANDSSSYANHGVADGNYAWVAGKIGPNSIEFSGDGSRVLVPDAPELTPASQVTVAAWVNPTEDQDDNARVVVKGGNDKEAYTIQMSDTEPDFMVRDPCGENLSVDSETDLEEDEWTHIAGSYDGSALKFYVNGHMTNSEDVNTFPLFYDSNGLAIGNRSDANDKEFIGKIDDVRLYDVALSQADVVYLASDGGGYIPLVSVADIYKLEPEGQKAVNLRDIAELLNSWLEKKYWP